MFFSLKSARLSDPSAFRPLTLLQCKVRQGFGAPGQGFGHSHLSIAHSLPDRVHILPQVPHEAQNPPCITQLITSSLVYPTLMPRKHFSYRYTKNCCFNWKLPVEFGMLAFESSLIFSFQKFRWKVVSMERFLRPNCLTQLTTTSPVYLPLMYRSFSFQYKKLFWYVFESSLIFQFVSKILFTFLVFRGEVAMLSIFLYSNSLETFQCSVFTVFLMQFLGENSLATIKRFLWPNWYWYSNYHQDNFRVIIAILRTRGLGAKNYLF